MYHLLDDMQGKHFFSFFDSTMEITKQFRGKQRPWRNRFGMYFLERENLRTKSDLKAKFESHGHLLDDNVVEQGEEEEGLD